MKPLGLLVTFAGYTIAYFGWCSLRGEGVGFVDLLVPGRDVTIPDGTTKAAKGDKPLGFPDPKTGKPGPLRDKSGQAIPDPYKSFPGGVGGLGSFG